MNVVPKIDDHVEEKKWKIAGQLKFNGFQSRPL